MSAPQSDDDLRAEVRAWLADHWRGGLPARSESFGRDPRSAWLQRVVEAGWAAPRWPLDWYGRALDEPQARLVEAEFAAVGAPGSGQDRTNLWANTALKYAAEPFRRTIVPELLAGRVGMCLLYSEPGAGSDLAAIRTRADRHGDDFLVTGQKLWTSRA